MPLYEYKCDKCGHRFEKIEKHSASEMKKCPKCGAHAPRQLSAPGIQFKGSGWYVTDYGGKSSSAPTGEGSGDGSASKSEKSEKSDKSDKSQKSDTKSGDSKSSSDKSEKSSSKKDRK